MSPCIFGKYHVIPFLQVVADVIRLIRVDHWVGEEQIHVEVRMSCKSSIYDRLRGTLIPIERAIH